MLHEHKQCSHGTMKSAPDMPVHTCAEVSLLHAVSAVSATNLWLATWHVSSQICFNTSCKGAGWSIPAQKLSQIQVHSTLWLSCHWTQAVDVTADVDAVQGIKATKSKPNSYLYQALALMATELNYTEEARQWFMEGTKTVMVSCQHAHLHCVLPSMLSIHFLFHWSATAPSPL